MYPLTFIIITFGDYCDTLSYKIKKLRFRQIRLWLRTTLAISQRILKSKGQTLCNTCLLGKGLNTLSLLGVMQVRRSASVCWS